MALTGKGGVEGMMEDKKNIAELISLALIEDDGSRFKHRYNIRNIYEILKSKDSSIEIEYEYTITANIYMSSIRIKGIKVELGSDNDLKIEQAIETWIINRAKEEVCYPRLSMMESIKRFFKISTEPKGPKGSFNVVTDSDCATGPMFYNQK